MFHMRDGSSTSEHCLTAILAWRLEGLRCHRWHLDLWCSRSCMTIIHERFTRRIPASCIALLVSLDENCAIREALLLASIPFLQSWFSLTQCAGSSL